MNTFKIVRASPYNLVKTFAPLLRLLLKKAEVCSEFESKV